MIADIASQFHAESLSHSADNEIIGFSKKLFDDQLDNILSDNDDLVSL